MKKNVPIILIIIVLILIIYFIYQYRFKIKANLESSGLSNFIDTNLNLQPSMADVSGIYDHINKWEGGLVNNPADPGGLTNRGITLTTFKNLAPKLLGIEGNADNLRALTDDQWKIIIKWFWDQVCGDEINDQCIANIIMDWYWGSGDWAISNVVRVLNNNYGYSIEDKRVNAKMTQEIIDAINAQDPVDLYKNLYNQRIAYYNNIVQASPSLSVFLKGWTNRANDLQC